MPNEIVWTRHAQEDLREIRAFIARDAPATASIFVRRLRQSVERLRMPGDFQGGRGGYSDRSLYDDSCRYHAVNATTRGLLFLARNLGCGPCFVQVLLPLGRLVRFAPGGVEVDEA
jgi:plasmid stabilization system protein ParE